MAIGHAEKAVLLLSHKLDRELYGSDWFTEEARKFLSRSDSKLDILVESDLEEDHPVARLAEEFSEHVSIRRVPDELVDTYPYNYMVVDDAGYRFERDREEPQAVVFFNEGTSSHRDFVQTLKNNFAALASRSA